MWKEKKNLPSDFQGQQNTSLKPNPVHTRKEQPWLFEPSGISACELQSHGEKELKWRWNKKQEKKGLWSFTLLVTFHVWKIFLQNEHFPINIDQTLQKRSVDQPHGSRSMNVFLLVFIVDLRGTKILKPYLLISNFF